MYAILPLYLGRTPQPLKGEVEVAFAEQPIHLNIKTGSGGSISLSVEKG